MKRIVCALIGISSVCILLGAFLAYRWSIQGFEPNASPKAFRPVTMVKVAEVLSDFDEIIPIGLETSDALENRTWVTAFYPPISNSNIATINARCASGSSIVDELVCEVKFVHESSPREIVGRLTTLVFGSISNQQDFNLKDMHEGATYVSSGWSRQVVRVSRDYLLIKYVHGTVEREREDGSGGSEARK